MSASDPTATQGTTRRLGDRLRQARLARNYTQGDLAGGNFSVSYISAVERGMIKPSLGALERLAQKLEVPISDLLREGNGPLPGPGERAGSEREEVQRRIVEAQVALRQGNGQGAASTLTQALSRARAARMEGVVRAHLAAAYSTQANYKDAVREATTALTLAEKQDDNDLIQQARFELGRAQAGLHKYQLALDHFRACLDVQEQSSRRDPVFYLQTLYQVGTQHWNLGDYSTAVEQLTRAAEVAKDVLRPEWLASAFWTLSASHRAAGDFDRAAMDTLRCLAAYDALANRQLSARINTRLGRAYARSGQLDEALTHLHAAQSMAGEQEDVLGAAEAARSIAEVRLRQGRHDEALAAIAEALDRAEASNDAVARGEALLIRAQTYDAMGNSSTAEKDYDAALEQLKEAGEPQPLSDALAQYSAMLERRGQGGRALEMLKQAWALRDQLAPRL